MAVGQRFDCRDAACADRVSCLYAAAPPRPAGSQWIAAEDVLDDNVWPWAPVEAWLATKINQIGRQAILDPTRPASEWATRDEPVVFKIGENAFARRVYHPFAGGSDLTVPIWFWTSKGRLFTLFCTIDGIDPAVVRPPIHWLLDRLHPGEPVRGDTAGR